jgi:hypothetical protein
LEDAEMSKEKFLKNSKIKGVMYHGTMHDIDHGKVRDKIINDGGIREFKPGDHHLMFATPDAKFANSYAYPGDKSISYPAAVYPLHVHAKNPWDYENKSHVNNLVNALDTKNISDPKDYKEDMRQRLSRGDWLAIERPEVLEAARRLGHDAMHMEEGGAKNIGVFSPNQFKSAIGNNGDYDMSNPDITKKRGGMIQRKAMGGSMFNPQEMDNIGANEAADMNPKMYINPDPSGRGIGNVGGAGDSNGMPIGGIQPPQQGGLPQQGMGQPQLPQGPQQPMGNMLNMTKQGQEMNAMQAPTMAKGGVVNLTHQIVNIKNGKVVGKFTSLKDAKVSHSKMENMEEHAIEPIKKLAKSLDIMRAELLVKKGKK